MVFGFMAAGEREHRMDAVDQAIFVRTTVVFDYVQPAEQSELPDGITR